MLEKKPDNKFVSVVKILASFIHIFTLYSQCVSQHVGVMGSFVLGLIFVVNHASLPAS